MLTSFQIHWTVCHPPTQHYKIHHPVGRWRVHNATHKRAHTLCRVFKEGGIQSICMKTYASHSRPINKACVLFHLSDEWRWERMAYLWQWDHEGGSGNEGGWGGLFVPNSNTSLATIGKSVNSNKNTVLTYTNMYITELYTALQNEQYEKETKQNKNYEISN